MFHLVFLPRQCCWGRMLWGKTHVRASVVWKMYLLSNMAIFGIYVRFQGGITFSCPEKCFNRGISVPQNPHSLDRELDVKYRAALFNRSWPVEHVETWLSILLEHVATMDSLQKNWGCFPCFFLNAPM